MNNRNTRLLAAGTAVLLMLALARVGQASDGPAGPAGRTLHAGRATAPVSVFESAAPIRSTDLPKAAVVFDPAALPSNYETCYQETWKPRYLKIARPLDGASFPRNIAAPEVRWGDQVDNVWLVSLKAPGWAEPLRVVTDARAWRPDEATWEAIKASGTGGPIELEVRGCQVEGGRRAGEDVYVDRVTFKVSTYPADPIIVYRMVTPLFHGFKTPDIYYRDISTFAAAKFLDGSGAYCTNCHSFPIKPTVAAKDEKLAIAVRKSLPPEDLQRFLGIYNFASRTGKTMNINSFFMSWDPDGEKVAVTTGENTYVRPLITLETQEFYVVVADIMIVDTATMTVRPLPGASQPQYMESFPAWSPDGTTIVFARADEMGVIFREKQFNLYKVPYNDGEGGEPVPIPGASNNNRSNFAPRFSPDGKWIVFNQADWSSLVAPRADLWIVSTEDGAEPRPLECNAPLAMDSAHSWSSNSRWLVFSCKRDDGIFARLYLTEIDDEGHASPPVELPTLDDTMMCYNVPEFLKYSLSIDAKDILAKTSRLQD